MTSKFWGKNSKMSVDNQRFNYITKWSLAVTKKLSPESVDRDSARTTAKYIVHGVHGLGESPMESGWALYGFQKVPPFYGLWLNSGCGLKLSHVSVTQPSIFLCERAWAVHCVGQGLKSEKKYYLCHEIGNFKKIYIDFAPGACAPKPLLRGLCPLTPAKLGTLRASLDPGLAPRPMLGSFGRASHILVHSNLLPQSENPGHAPAVIVNLTITS